MKKAPPIITGVVIAFIVVFPLFMALGLIFPWFYSAGSALGLIFPGSYSYGY